MNFDRPGGNITRVIELYSGLKKRGYDMKILLPFGSGARYAKSLQNVFSYKSPYLENAFLNYVTGQVFHNYLFSKYDFLNDADIIHADISSIFPLSRLDKIIKKGNVVFDLHSIVSLDLEPFIPKYLRYCLLPALNWAQGRIIKKSHTIAVSYTMKKYLELIHGPSQKIHVIHPGTNIDHAKEMTKKYSDKYEWMRSGSDVIITYIGTFLPAEGLINLINAMKITKRKMKDVKLILIGGGPQELELKALVKHLKLEKEVTIHGWIPYDETFAAQAQSDILVSPIKPPIKGSIISSIVFPVKIPNYLAAGKPIISSKFGDIPIAIRDGYEGILLQDPNPNTIADALITLVSNESMREEYGNNCRRRANIFSWNNSLNKLERIYECIH